MYALSATIKGKNQKHSKRIMLIN